MHEETVSRLSSLIVPVSPAIMFSLENHEEQFANTNDIDRSLTSPLLLPVGERVSQSPNSDVCFPFPLDDKGLSLDSLRLPPPVNQQAKNDETFDDPGQNKAKRDSISSQRSRRFSTHSLFRRKSNFGELGESDQKYFAPETRLRMWTVSNTGKVGNHESHTETWDSIDAFRKRAITLLPNSECFWLDVLAPMESDLKYLSQVFRIHPLTVEDIEKREDREKCELFRNYYFVVTRYLRDEDAIFENSQCLYIVVLKQGVVSFHFNDVPYPDIVSSRIKKLSSFFHISPGWINYALIDAITDSFVSLVDSAEMEVQNIDDLSNVVPEKDQMDMLRRIGSCRKMVTNLLRGSVVKLDMIKSLIKRSADDSKINKHSKHENLYQISTERPMWDAVLFLGDVQDHLLTMVHDLANLEAALSRAHQNYLAQISIEVSRASNKTNDSVGKITFFASLLVPMSLVAGLFGMNVKVPWRDDDDLNAFIGILIGSASFGSSNFNPFSAASASNTSYPWSRNQQEELSARLLEQSNDDSVDKLHSKIAALKHISIQIHDDVQGQNRFLGEM
ncbi:CorA metal ion transporter, partial [Nowakowskiella sp. JEL0078]